MKTRKYIESKIHILVLLLLFLCSCKQREKIIEEHIQIQPKSVEMPIAKSLYKDLNGNTILLKNYIGKKILVNYWATWCRPCLEEMSSLERAHSLLAKENFVLLLVSGESTKTIKDFKSKTNFNFDYLKYTGDFSELNIYALPTTHIYNEKGEKITEIVGAYEWDSPEILNKLKNIK